VDREAGWRGVAPAAKLHRPFDCFDDGPVLTGNR
jgi:hypothetical protein